MLTGVSWEGALAHLADLESYMGRFEHSDSCDSQDMRCGTRTSMEQGLVGE